MSLSPNLDPPAGSISETSYSSQEEALKAASLGIYDLKSYRWFFDILVGEQGKIEK